MAAFRLTKSALPTLLKALTVARERLATSQERYRTQEQQLGRSIEKEIAKLQQNLDEFNRRESEANAAIVQLSAQKKPKSGLIGRLFKITELPKSVQDEIVRQRLLIRAITDSAAAVRQQYSGLTSIQSAVLDQSSWVTKLESEIERRQRKKNKVIELKAAAAANAKQTRKIAISVKTQMEKQPNCPYCNGALGDAPHADHIYPVSKGGRSVPRNMIWVCAECNTRKRDLTLTGFIKKYQYNRIAIEARLESLGKDY